MRLEHALNHLFLQAFNLVTILAVIISGSIFLNNEDEINDDKIYKWSIGVILMFCISGLLSFFAIIFYAIKAKENNGPEYDEEGKEITPRITQGLYVLPLIMLFIMMIWGCIIYFNLSNDEKDNYENNHADLYLFFKIMFWYCFVVFFIYCIFICFVMTATSCLICCALCNDV